MNGPRNPLLVVAIVFAASALGFSSATDVFITPDGSSQGVCTTSPQTASWFNKSANWGSGNGQIGPGTTVHLCGTFTAAAGTNGYLTAQGSGASGSPVVIHFETGAVIQAPYWSSTASGSHGGAINLGGNSYITVDGGANGVIQATANGTQLANQQDEGTGVYADGGSNLTIENLTISNLYVHTCTLPVSTCTDEGGQDTIGVYVVSGSNIAIQNNIVHDMKWCLYYGYEPGTESNVTISGNEAYDCDHGVFVVDGNANSKLNGMFVSSNKIHDGANWDDAAINNHHDGIHTVAEQTGSQLTGGLAYNNYIYGNWGNNLNAFIFQESTTNPQSTLVFNNVLTDGGTVPHSGCGYICLEPSNSQVYNNTIVGMGPSSGSGVGIDFYGTGASAENNTISSMEEAIALQGSASKSNITLVDYNNYYSIGGNGWDLDSSFSAWQPACSCDSHSSLANPNLNSSYQPTSTSTALIQQGQNLTSLNVVQLDSDYAGNVRPNSGSCSPLGSTNCWDIGANQYASGNAPTAPTGLSAIVQ